MFRHDTPAETEFRMDVRTWLEANLPAALRGANNASAARGTDALVSHAVAQGLDRAALAQAIWRHGRHAERTDHHDGGAGARRRAASAGAGPQSHRPDPDGVRKRRAEGAAPAADHCGLGDLGQGYSEPGAGSDLASLSTRATLEGDHFVVKGQKIWTTWAHHSDWMFALVRTDPQAQPRQAGISFLLIDLHSPGIKVRPIKTIAGDDEFAECFFDDVIVPAGNLVGKLNDGWRIANALLGHERLGTSNPQFALIALERIKTMARASGIMADPAFQDRLAAASINVTAMAALFSHAVELTNQEQSPGPESSIIKIFGSELLQSLNELLIEAAGGHAPTEHPIATDFGEVDVATPFLQVAARDDLRRLIGNPAQRRGPPRSQPARTELESIRHVHGTASDIGADFVARQRRQIRRGGGAEGRARISRAGAELRAGAAARGGRTRLARHSGSGFRRTAWVSASPSLRWCWNRPGAGLSASRSGLRRFRLPRWRRVARRIRCWSG